MNIARKINTAALSAYQMIYNLLLIAVCVALTVVWLVSLVKNPTPWNGIDEKGNGGLCQYSVPQAIMCALQASDFEDAIRNAVSIGGDSDTISCITGGIAEALFGIPEHLLLSALSYLPDELLQIVTRFEKMFGKKILV
jgi:hypothetical protein